MTVEILNLFGTAGITGTHTIDFGETLGRNVYLIQQGIVVHDTANNVNLLRLASGIAGGNPNMCRWEAQRGGVTFETIPRRYYWNAQQRPTGAGTCAGLPVTAVDEQPVKLTPIMRYLQDVDNLRLVITANNGIDVRGWIWYVKVR